MIKQQKFNDQDQVFESTQEKKELYGEVFTPYILIEMMLTSIPIKHFTNKNNIWLDIGAGTGYYSIYLYYKLFENLKKSFFSEEECKKHIIKNMLYMVEIQETNVMKLRKLFGEDANIIFDDYLNYSPKFKPDFIIGNPPFNGCGIKKVPTNTNLNKKLDGKTIWTDFIKKSVTLLKENTGILCVIIPSIWMKPYKENMYNFLTQYQLTNIHCFSNTETNKIFKGNGQTPCCYFSLQKKKSNQTITIYDKSISKYIELKITGQKPIPVFAQSVIKKMQKYLYVGTIPIIKTNMPSSKTNFSLQKTKWFPHSNISSCILNNNKCELVINYSNFQCSYANSPKLILAHKMYGFPYLDEKGEYGISNRDNYVILADDIHTIDKLKIIQKFLSTKTSLFLFEGTRYRMKYLEKYIFELIPNIIFLPNFPQVINDDTIAEFFNFDDREKKAIDIFHKNEYHFFV